MSRIRISAGGHVFIAETHPDAPQTVAAFSKLLELGCKNLAPTTA